MGTVRTAAAGSQTTTIGTECSNPARTQCSRLSMARRRAAQSNRRNVSFVAADAQTYLFESAQYDIGDQQVRDDVLRRPGSGGAQTSERPEPRRVRRDRGSPLRSALKLSTLAPDNRR